jgi:heptaprenyl diphosphate synthase
MDITSTQGELGKEPGTDLREGVYTLPVLHALHRGPDRRELRDLLAEGAPDGERLVRALQIVRGEGSISHARRAVGAEVRRAVGLAKQLPDGAARDALVQLTRFLAIRCGADPGESDA